MKLSITMSSYKKLMFRNKGFFMSRMISFLMTAFFILFSKLIYADFKEVKTQTVPLVQSGKYKPDYIWWKNERAKRQKNLDNYMKKHKDEVYWFNYYPVGYSGVPAIIFRMFKDVFPEMWGKNYVKDFFYVKTFLRERFFT